MPAEAGPAQPAPDAGTVEIALVPAQALVADLFPRRAFLYWPDFLGSVAIAYGCAYWYLTGGDAYATRLGAFLIAGLLLYRAGTFIHEIVHFSKGTLPGFRTTWNILFGVPLCMPWQFYRSHVDHHNKVHFATPRDAEYLPLALGPLTALLRYLAQIPLLVPLAVARFAIVPLTYLHPRLRRMTLERLSAFGINPHYRCRQRSAEDERGIIQVEWACCVWVWALALALWQGVLEARTLGLVYLLMTYTLGMNWIRTLAAHRYDNPGESLSLTRQVTDSINITGQPWITAWLFPIGLNYHALHHLFPLLPYHALATAHRRLLAALPEDSPYRTTELHHTGAIIRSLWRRARRPGPEAARAAALWRSG